MSPVKMCANSEVKIEYVKVYKWKGGVVLEASLEAIYPIKFNWTAPPSQDPLVDSSVYANIPKQKLCYCSTRSQWCSHLPSLVLVGMVPKDKVIFSVGIDRFNFLNGTGGCTHG